MANIYSIPFSLVRKTPYLSSALNMLTMYRGTSFTEQDGASEWKGNGRMYFAEVDSELAGLFRLDESRTHYGLSSFVVNPDMRGMGVGASMLKSIQNLDKPVYLNVKQDNPAISLYKRNMFEILETKNGRHHMKRKMES